ncbi:HD domain-containing protein [Oceanobacillus kimchii]|uniref:HD domain-containing protein n=1 Tax=Oceanobacillus kimchii TaxID=746691 RepID=UPI0021A96CDF|nr:HD domain-containing protein [Oceanobacillus kimchii]MCT1577662.1 HD domain-containing protein [Oceanobacillus kimchii]MCT2136650.1 HD domain-containing protein [Oceanobacillus kimchii]
MLYVDEIYGEFEIGGVLVDLIESDSIQRLKGVYQGGASALVSDKWNVTRFEHSLGVMLLVKQLGGSLEEQIAALLHDVSHTAFSHVIDHVMENRQENYHELIFQRLIEESTIPTILESYGYDYQTILFHIEQWRILERDAPHLCADRVDYTLRDLYRSRQVECQDIERFLEDLTIIDGYMHLRTINVAEWFVQIYYQEVLDYFLHPKNIYAYDQLSKVLRDALDEKVIVEDDFLKRDNEVLELLKRSGNKDITEMLKSIHKDIQVVTVDDNFDIYIKMKPRLIDPDIIIGDEVIPVSHVSTKAQQMNNYAKERAEKGTGIRIIQS